MNTAYESGEIVQVGPKFGTLRKSLQGENIPNLERKKPPTSEAIADYTNNLVNVSEWPVTLSSHTIRAQDVKRMRVRGSKPGPNGKKGTDLDLLAKAHERFAFGKLEKRVNNTGFNKFGEVRVETPNGYIWQHNSQLNTVKQVAKVKSICLASPNILMAVNGLFRQILLFKGIGFAQIEQDIKTAGKPVTYNVNTVIEVDALQKKNAALTRRFKVYKITVKKTFRNIENIMGQEQEQCKIFFSGECCKNATLWLQTLQFEIS